MYHHSADSLIIHILAWMSTQDVRARIAAQMETQRQLGEPYQQMQALVSGCLEEALACFAVDPIWGPALSDLARQCLAQNGWQSPVADVARAIGVEGLVEPGHALFYLVKEDGEPSCSVPQRGAKDTHLLVARLAERGAFADRLGQMSQHWRGDGCLGAANLRHFFLGYLQLLH